MHVNDSLKMNRVISGFKRIGLRPGDKKPWNLQGENSLYFTLSGCVAALRSSRFEKFPHAAVNRETNTDFGLKFVAGFSFGFST
jgi:hypothetical protein